MCVRNESSANFGLWVNDVTVLSDMEMTSLDALIGDSNSRCGDLASSLPLLNHLRASEAKPEPLRVPNEALSCGMRASRAVRM